MIVFYTSCHDKCIYHVISNRFIPYSVYFRDAIECHYLREQWLLLHLNIWGRQLMGMWGRDRGIGGAGSALVGVRRPVTHSQSVEGAMPVEGQRLVRERMGCWGMLAAWNCLRTPAGRKRGVRDWSGAPGRRPRSAAGNPARWEQVEPAGAVKRATPTWVNYMMKTPCDGLNL